MTSALASRPKAPNRIFTSSVVPMWGLFEKGELIFVGHTQEEMEGSANRLSQRDNTKPRPTDKKFSIAQVVVVTSDLNALYLSDAKEILMESISAYRRLQREEEKMIEEATKLKSMLPPDYWQPRYKAWLKVEASKRIVEAFEKRMITSSMHLGG
jgi:hypothetical protein